MIPTVLLCAALLTSASLQDAPRVSAKLSSTSAHVGETIVYEIAVEGATADVEISAPRFPTGLFVQGTQDFSEMHISFPGGRSTTRRREFVLRPTGPGRYAIPSVAVRVGNRSYRTNAVELTVSGSARLRSFTSSDEAWLRATMDPETVYVGQQSTLTVEAGFSEEVRVRLTRPPVFETPSPTGFWVQDIPGGVQSRLRSVDGRVSEVQSLQRAYFPLSAGKFAFAAARAVIDVREGFLFAPETRELRSTSPRLIVLPLPEQNRPPEFRGAVGSYAIRAFVEPDTVAAGEAAQITIEVSGIGNVKAAPQPTLPSIPGVEQFAPTEEASVTFSGASVRGVKKFQWLVIPERAGTVTVPPITYAFFDPILRTYQTVRTSPLTIVVRNAAAGEDLESSATSLRAIRSAPRPASLQWVRKPAFLIAQVVPLLLIAGALLMNLVRQRRPAEVDPLTALKKLHQKTSDYNEFLRELEALLRSTANRSAMDEALNVRLDALIGRIEAQRFSPTAIAASDRAAILAEAEAILRALRTNRRSGTAMPAAIALLLLVQQPVGTDFSRGVELYEQGHFAEAARMFEVAAQRDSLDVAAWSNLGNAHFRAGERGRAIWAWARAGREAPRDAAITRNLRTAGAVEVLRTRPPLSVRPVEWYLLAAIAWWIAGTIAALAIARRRWGLLPWALPPVAIAVVAMVVGAVADGRRYVVALNDETHMYGDPTVHSPIVRRVQAGAGLDVREDRGAWLRVRTISEAEGWVEADAVGKL